MNQAIPIKTVAPATPKNPQLTEAEADDRIRQIVILNIWNDLPDRGRANMIVDVFRDPTLAAAMEDFSQIYCELNWESIYTQMAIILHCEHRVIEPSTHYPRDVAFREAVGNQMQIAQHITNTFSDKIGERIDAAIAEHDAQEVAKDE